MSDILSIIVPLGSSYPSVNHVGKDGFRGGRKSDAYRKLFADVEQAARAEIERTGWTKAETECSLTIVRFTPHRRRIDAGNMSKCENDSLTAAGVWTDDSLATPCTLIVRYDPDGQHRLAIVVVKLHQSPTSLPKSDAGPLGAESGSSSRRRAVVGKSAAPYIGDAVDRWKPGDPIPNGYALLGAKLVTREFALEKAGIK